MSTLLRADSAASSDLVSVQALNRLQEVEAVDLYILEALTPTLNPETRMLQKQL
jgi:hypothetical protein